MPLEFEWDRRKAVANLRKHGVLFSNAIEVFADALSITTVDPDHSEEEDRFVTIGATMRGRLLIVIHAERDKRIRIISARPATKRERAQYEEG